MNDSILIIGNGPSALKKEYGVFIDQYKEVARINNYKLSGYYSFIGSKTTIWFNGANRKLKKRNYKIPKTVIVAIPYQLLYKKENEIIKRTPKRLGLLPEEYKLISKDRMKHYENTTNIKRPTTGLSCILWAMENYKNVIIHGFDFFMNSRHHYYDSFLLKKILDIGLTSRAKKHDNFAEKKYVDDLIRRKKIYNLSDVVDCNHS